VAVNTIELLSNEAISSFCLFKIKWRKKQNNNKKQPSVEQQSVIIRNKPSHLINRENRNEHVEDALLNTLQFQNLW
jgi:hypothetical protein